jgi:hypothetical protein
MGFRIGSKSAKIQKYREQLLPYNQKEVNYFL